MSWLYDTPTAHQALRKLVEKDTNEALLLARELEGASDELDRHAGLLLTHFAFVALSDREPDRPF